MYKLYTFCFSLIVLFSFNSLNAYAYSTISKDDPGNLTGILRYDQPTDSIMFSINTGAVNKIDQRMYSDSSYTDLLDSSVNDSQSSFLGAGARCAGYYIVVGYYGATKKFTYKFKIDSGDTSATNCPKPTDKPPTETENGQPINIIIQQVTSSTSVVVNCDISGVCSCIAKLQQATETGLNAVESAVQNSGNKVSNAVDRANASITGAVDTVADTLKDTNKKLDIANNTLSLIDDDLNDFHDEFVTDKDYKIKDLPQILLEQPQQPQKPFEDNNVYFTDQGDEVVPGRLPSAPDIKDWDGVTKQDEIQKDDETKKDSELTSDKFDKDSELTSDKFDKDSELTKTEFEQNLNLKKDNEMSKDQMNQDGEMSRDQMNQDSEMSRDQMNQDGEMSKDQMNQDNEMSQNHHYSSTNKMGGD